MLLFSCQVISDSLWPQGLWSARLLCPPLSPRVCSKSCPLNPWCHLTISSSAAETITKIKSHKISTNMTEVCFSEIWACGSSSLQSYEGPSFPRHDALRFSTSSNYVLLIHRADWVADLGIPACGKKGECVPLLGKAQKVCRDYLYSYRSCLNLVFWLYPATRSRYREKTPPPLFFFLTIWLHLSACGILVSQPGMEPWHSNQSGTLHLTTGPRGDSLLVLLMATDNPNYSWQQSVCHILASSLPRLTVCSSQQISATPGLTFWIL